MGIYIGNMFLNWSTEIGIGDQEKQRTNRKLSKEKGGGRGGQAGQRFETLRESVSGTVMGLVES